MACFESEYRDKIEIPLPVTKAFWEEAKNQLAAGRNYEDIINDIAKRTNLSPYMVARALTKPKAIRNITDKMWREHQARQEFLRLTRQAVDDADTHLRTKIIEKAWDSTRTTLTAGHGLAFPFTHMRESAIVRGESDIFRATVRRALSYAGKDGYGRWKNDMDELQLRESYRGAVQAGLDVRVGSNPTGILLKGAHGWSRRSYDALKIARLDLWERQLSSLKKAGGVSPETLKILADEINHATGSVNLPNIKGVSSGRILSKTMFAPKVYFARRMAAIFDPIKAISKGGEMTPAERQLAYFAVRRWVQVVGIQASIVAANYAFNKYVLGESGSELPNLSDPLRSDWMRLKVGGLVLPLSPMFEALKEPVQMLSAMVVTKPVRRRHGLDDNPFAAAGEIAWRSLGKTLHPTLDLAIEQTTGRETWSGRSVPNIRDALGIKEKETRRKESVVEYVGTRFAPMPITGAIHELYQALRDEGMSPTEASMWIRGLGSGAMTIVGMHGYRPTKRPDLRHMKKKDREELERRNAEFRWIEP